ncbi:JAB domain-containing protein [Sphingomonas glacialis]|uniref:JAB domain-containing protein n=1 Tax=Sphingomonas glacialis TaxID=658225 RepID=UPI00240D1564|nr:JAB domain-containing protein [Sphingomonas glacialis]
MGGAADRDPRDRDSPPFAPGAAPRRGPGLGQPFALDQALSDHLVATIGRCAIERVRVFFVDRQGRLLRDAVVSEGDGQSVTLPIATIVRQALAVRAAGILVVHNHPSGALAPSSGDRIATRALRRRADAAGIALIEHLIVARTGCSGILAASLAAS